MSKNKACLDDVVCVAGLVLQNDVGLDVFEAGKLAVAHLARVGFVVVEARAKVVQVVEEKVSPAGKRLDANLAKVGRHVLLVDLLKVDQHPTRSVCSRLIFLAPLAIFLQLICLI